MIYLLDTNVCIDIIRRKRPAIIDRIQSHDVGDIAVGSITVAELEYGVAKSQHTAQNKIALIQFLAPFEILPFDQPAAEQYGSIRQNLEADGHPIGPMDMLIAAQALAADLTIVTKNVGEFSRVQDLRIEDWTM